MLLRQKLIRWSINTGLVLCFFTVLPYFAQHFWALELFSHFRIQYGAAFVLCGLVLLSVRNFIVGFVFLAFAAANLVYLTPYYSSPPDFHGEAGSDIRLASVNIRSSNDNYEKILNFISTTAPDIAVFIEVTPAWEKQLTRLATDYPFSLTFPRHDNFGIAIFSRHRLSGADVTYLSDTGIPSLLARLESESGTLTLLGIHLNWPLGADTMRDRNAQLRSIAELSMQTAGPFVVIGDMNTSPWSPYFSELLRQTGLRDSALGYGPTVTWPAFFPPLLIPIDRCLVSEDVEVTNLQVSDYLGSDHFALTVDIRY